MSNTITRIKESASGKLPDDFLRLQDCLMLLLPIHTKAEYKKALAVAQKLAAREDLTRIQQFYLESLANNIKAYEQKHFPVPKADPIETLKFLLDENGLNGSDLGRLLNQRQLGSKILNRKRKLSIRHIMILAKYFSVSPALFISE
ncbi:MAG: type II toxin-antitoxin system HigA family antitoxin [Sedimentisphaerales bacterium]